MTKPKKFNNSSVNTVIGEESSVIGSIHSQRSLRIEGMLEGDINAKGDVFIGEKSYVKGNIVAKNVIVSGEVVGDIDVVKGLHISKTGKVYGNISGDHLYLEEGGIYRGSVNMDVVSSKNAFEGHVVAKL